MNSESVKISPKLQKLFDKGYLVTDNARLKFREGLIDMRDYARKNMKYKSAKAQQSIDQRLISDNPLKGELFINESQSMLGVYMHTGTGLYGPFKSKYAATGGIVINPKIKKILRFVGMRKTGGEGWISKKQIINKGMHPDPFVKRAIDIRLPKVMENVEHAILKDYGMV